jgi:hypothetical protein
MAGRSAQQLFACTQGATWCVNSLASAGELAGQQSVREVRLAQAIAGWIVPSKDARTTIEAISRRNTNATSGSI